MNSESRWLHWITWGFLGLVVMAIGGVFINTLLQKRPEPLPVYGTVPDFVLTNQFGEAVARADLLGQVWIANIIFTRCSGPCLDLSRRMRQIRDGLPPGSSIRLVSLTADPEFDSPEVLRGYGQGFGATSKQWQFLTGAKPVLYHLATSGLKLAVQENTAVDAGADPFIHSTRLVVVDQRGRLRGVSGDDEGPESMRALLETAKRLVLEERQ